MINQVLIEDSDNYFVREDGKIIGKSGKILKPATTIYGYNEVSIKLNGKFKSQKVHRLVAQAFIPNPYNLPEVNHINGIKTDNRVENLEWVTSQDNQLHATRILGKGAGETHPGVKITEDMVRKACVMFAEGYQNKEVSDVLGISKHTIQKIRKGKVWKTVVNEYVFPEKSRALSVETVEWICKKLCEGKSSVEVRNMSTNPRVTLQVIKAIKGRHNYRWVSEKYDF